MGLIKIDPDIISNISKKIGANAARASAVGNFVKLAGLLARTYAKNSFGPQVRSICNEGSSRGAKLGINLYDSSGVLSLIALNFLGVDNKFLRTIIDRLRSLFETKIIVEPPHTPTKIGDEITIPSGFTKPQSPINKEFTISEHWMNYKNHDGLHNGIDIIASDKSGEAQIRPIAPGKIVKVTSDGYNDGGYGNMVLIEHRTADGEIVYSRYAHLKNPPQFSVGDSVGNSTILGEMGESGMAYGSHLHLEVFKDGAKSWYEGTSYYFVTPSKGEAYNNAKKQITDGFYDPANIISGDSDLLLGLPLDK